MARIRLNKRANIIQKMLLIPEDLWIVTGTDIRDMWLDRNDLHELFDDLLEKDDPDGYNKCIIRGILWFNGKPQKTYFNQVNQIKLHPQNTLNQRRDY